jgi:hypothetical protein
MVAVRGSGTGLSPADLERVRDTLAAGRKPKVVFTKSAGQVAGQLGQIIGLTDPGLSDEWLMVRFGRDELPFSPADLSMAPRPAPRKAGAVPSPREESSLSPVSKSAESVTVAAEVPAAPVSGSPGEPSSEVLSPAVPAAVVEAVSPPSQKGTESAGSGKGTSTAAGRSARKAGVRAKAPASSLTVTLTYTDGEWMVSATQGSRSLAKPYLVKPAEALRMVSMLDVAGVREAVEEIVAAARDEAQRRAETLRMELAEVEARLAELRDES